MTSIQEDIEREFPPSSRNNSREIVRRKLKIFHDSPSEWAQVQVENMTGWVGDYQSSDAGTGARGANE